MRDKLINFINTLLIWTVAAWLGILMITTVVGIAWAVIALGLMIFNVTF